MGCGVTVVDERKCLGCGVCTTKCEFDAVKLYKVHDAVPPTSPDAWAAALPSQEFDAMTQRFLNQTAAPPVLIAVKKQLRRNNP